MPNQSTTVTSRDRVAGAFLVSAGVAAQALWMGRAAAVLGIALVISYLLWSVARWNNDPARVLRVYLLAVALQCVHFAEEYATGFQRQFPKLLGYEWSGTRFATFNMIWLGVFLLAGLGVYRRWPPAFLVVIFFALGGGVANGAGHLLLMATRGGYFPGGATAPFCLVLGIILLGRLFGQKHGPV